MKNTLQSILLFSTLTLSLPSLSSSQEAGEKKTFEEQWETVATNQKLSISVRLDQMIRPEVTKISVYFQFDDERQEEMESLLEAVLDEATDEYVKACRKVVESMDKKNREMTMKRGLVSNFLPGAPNYRKFDPSTRSSWKEGLKSLLTQEEFASWEERKQRLEREKYELLARKLILLIEREIILLPEQREVLGSTITALMKAEPAMQRMQAWSSVNTRTFAQFLSRKDNVEKISSRLDSVQKGQFKDWTKLVTGYSEKLGIGAPKLREKEPDKTYRERVIASVIQAHKVKDMQVRLRVLQGRVKHLDEIVTLTPEQRSELDLAVKGMVELMYEEHLTTLEINTRRWVTSVKDGNYMRYLQNQRVQRCLKAPDDSLWEVTRQRVLTDKQKEILDALIPEKEEFEETTAMTAIRLKSEQLLNLREEQWEALAPLLETAIVESLPDLEKTYPNTQEPWFFNSYRVLYPYKKIPQNQLHDKLTKRQWLIWTSEIEAKLNRAVVPVNVARPGIEAIRVQFLGGQLERK